MIGWDVDLSVEPFPIIDPTGSGGGRRGVDMGPRRSVAGIGTDCRPRRTVATRAPHRADSRNPPPDDDGRVRSRHRQGIQTLARYRVKSLEAGRCRLAGRRSSSRGSVAASAAWFAAPPRARSPDLVLPIRHDSPEHLERNVTGCRFRAPRDEPRSCRDWRRRLRCRSHGAARTAPSTTEKGRTGPRPRLPCRTSIARSPRWPTCDRAGVEGSAHSISFDMDGANLRLLSGSHAVKGGLYTARRHGDGTGRRLRQLVGLDLVEVNPPLTSARHCRVRHRVARSASPKHPVNVGRPVKV